MERLVSSTVPTSDTAATATVVDGFTIEQSNHQGGNWSFTRNYNTTGILSTAIDPRGITTSTQTDIAGRPIIQSDGDGNETTTAYTTCCNNPASITDALGNTVNYSYDIRNRKIAEFGTGIQPATYGYDDADRLTTLRTFRVDNSTITTDPTGRTDGDTTTWAYHDATGLQLSKTFADGTQETRSYNALNQLASITNARGLTQTLTYNSQTAELASQNFASSPNRSFTYNHLGQLLSISDESGSQQLSYNNYSDLLTESTSIANQSYSRVEQYDNVGRNIGYQLQRDGSTIHQNRYAYDNRGRIASAGFYHTNNWQDFAYSYLQDTNILSTLEHPNGITSTRSYEPNRNLLTSIIDAKNGTTLSNKAYSYDAIARPTARTMNERSDTFAYDSKSQLIAAQLGSDSYAYAYDNIGNRKTAQELAEEITYATNSTNEYTAINDFTPEFDADGNQIRLQTSAGNWTVEYNAENRPTKFTSEDGNTIVEARYDYMGRRAWKKVTVNGNVNLHETYIYRAYLQIAAIDLRGANAGHFITWDPTQPTATRPLAIEQKGTWFTYGLDLSKNVTELYTAEGTIATSYSYSPFGAVEASGNESTLNPIQWSSEIADEELGLVYYNYRHYNPADGRWINRDPIAEEGGLNLYGFVGNQIWLIDDLGLEVEWCYEDTLGEIQVTSVKAILKHSERPKFDISLEFSERAFMNNVMDFIDTQLGIVIDRKIYEMELYYLHSALYKKISTSMQTMQSKLERRAREASSTGFIYNMFEVKIEGRLCCCNISYTGRKRFMLVPIKESAENEVFIDTKFYLPVLNFKLNDNNAKSLLKNQMIILRQTMEEAAHRISKINCDNFE